MNKKTALRLFKDVNMAITVSDEWAEIDEDNFLLILKNYIEVEE